MANEATWKTRVAAWRASGLTAPEFCSGRDYAVGTLRWWACRLERSAPPAPVVATPMRLLRVVRGTQAGPALGEPARGAGLVIEAAGVRITVHEGFDEAALSAVLDVLERRGRGARR